MKNKRFKILACLVIVAVFSFIQYSNVKGNYDELLSSSGLVNDSLQKQKSEADQQNAGKDSEQNSISGQELSGEEKEDDALTAVKKLSLHARGALLMDASNNRVLYEANGDKELPMASTTKIMTCIVTLENANLNDVVTVSSNAARMPDVQLNMKTGEQFYLRDLLYSLMLESHNDTAVAIAEHVGGSVEGFAAMMNKKAKELGCEHTNFVTPNGLDAQEHYTTAKDLATIASYAIRNKKFIDITNTSSHVFKEIKSGKSFQVSNKDRFLYMMEGAIGVKTGFTNGAGYCFVGAVRRTDRTLISVVLGCGWPPNKSLKWSDTKELMTYGLEKYKERQIFEHADLSPVFVNHGQQKYETLKLTGDLKLLMREDEKVTVVYDIVRALQAPVKENSVVGKAKYYINGTLYTTLPIYAKQDIAKIDLKYCFMQLVKFWSQQ